MSLSRLMVTLLSINGIACVSSEPFGGPACSEVKRVDLMRPGNICSQSSSIQGMTCQGAWDNDEVSSSIWHPGGSGAGASTAIYMGEELIIHRVTVRQFRWETGHASKMMLVIDGDTSLLRPVVDNDMTVSEWSPERPVVTSTVQLHILEIGPYTGNAFGGIETIDIFGCYKKDQHLNRSDQRNKEVVTEKQVLDATGIKEQVRSVSRGMGRSAPRDDMFNFDESLSVSAKRGDGDSGTVMYIIGGLVGLAIVVFIVFGVFHQLKARKRLSFDMIHESPRVSVKPRSSTESVDRIEIVEEIEDELHL